MSLKGKIEFYGITDAGCVRDHNEDAINIKKSLGLAVLADGMGGHKSGEIASAMAVSSITDNINKQLKQPESEFLNEETGYSMHSTAVHQSICTANTEIYKSSTENSRYQGMGTTVVVVLFYDNRFTVAHVGDSRLYRMRDGILKPITSDHSLMQELIDRGFYTSEQARKSHNKNLVTRAVGIQEMVDVDIQEDIVKTGDIYMLCSDGITDMIDDDLIYDTLNNNIDDLKKASEELLLAAKNQGGKDNISVILCRPIKSFPSKKGLFSKIHNFFS